MENLLAPSTPDMWKFCGTTYVDMCLRMVLNFPSYVQGIFTAKQILANEFPAPE